jgi:hypothetical protein
MSKNENENGNVRLDDPYENIYRYAQDYLAAMSDLQQGIKKESPYDETVAVIINVSELQKVLTGTTHVAAVLGLVDETLTVSFVGVDAVFNSKGKLDSAKVQDKYVNGDAPGQEVWPKLSLSKINDLLPAPKIKQK